MTYQRRVTLTEENDVPTRASGMIESLSRKLLAAVIVPAVTPYPFSRSGNSLARIAVPSFPAVFVITIISLFVYTEQYWPYLRKAASVETLDDQEKENSHA